MMSLLVDLLTTAAENWRIRRFERLDPRVLVGDDLLFWIRVRWSRVN